MNNKKLIEWFNEWNKDPHMPWSNEKSTHRDYLEKIYPNGLPVHPLTCGNDSSHENLIAYEENNIIKLKCKNCDYEQDYVPLLVYSAFKKSQKKYE